jgi:hypothetical protein
MDAVTPTVRRIESSLHAVPPASEAQRTLKVLAEYRLSEAGRKASLLSGGNGRARQRMKLTLPATRLHLVRVRPDGVARLKLQPQFRLDAEQRIVRLDQRPVYDHPPTLDELLQDAARNHELERGFYAQKTTTRATRHENLRTWLDDVAREFLSDPTRRAIVHPAPSPHQCQLVTSRGPMFFHTAQLTGLAREVPLEAFRRFQNDIRIRSGRAAIQREHDVVVREERRRAMDEWVRAHGTPDQRERFAEGMFPLSEWIAAVAETAFAPIAALPRYDSNGARCLQAFLREFPVYAHVNVTKADYRVVTRLLPTATPPQWEWLQWIRRAMPDAKVQLRERELVWTADPRAPRHRTIAILVTTKVGLVTVRRELVMPDGAPPASEPTKEDVCSMA